ncbi:MAG: efflux RND transporter periplasmic adaptor subunit [Candidatus Latescibacteria bacterium]|nr:efflux RND transporter periplasmic adaptor subunit [Candidatus Latescibacterota bacterium]
MKLSYILAALTLGCGASEPRPEAQNAAPLPVQVTRVVQVQVPVVSPALGATQAPASAVLATRLMGRIDQVAVAEGDRVQRGQVLARLEDGDLRAHLDQARAALQDARARGAQASREVERRRQLRRDQALPQEGLDQAETQYARAQAAEQSARAGVAQVEVELSYTQVRSPLDGVVVRKFAQRGDLATPGTPLLEVEQHDPLEVVAEVGETLYSSLGTGQEVEIEIPALLQRRSGRITALVPAADPRSRTFRVKVALPNPDYRLGSGLYARLLLPTRTRPALLIPAAALVQEGQLQGVYLHVDSRAQLRWVRLGQARGDQYEVLSGLEAGQQVISPPPANLRDGLPVEVR